MLLGDLETTVQDVVRLFIIWRFCGCSVGGKPESYDMSHEQFDFNAGMVAGENLNAIVRREYCGSCGRNHSSTWCVGGYRYHEELRGYQKSLQHEPMRNILWTSYCSLCEKFGRSSPKVYNLACPFIFRYCIVFSQAGYWPCYFTPGINPRPPISLCLCLSLSPSAAVCFAA